jgi:ElaB/YqjD/DUF883 family membrane-anchored ribosome-binding protein
MGIISGKGEAAKNYSSHLKTRIDEILKKQKTEGGAPTEAQVASTKRFVATLKKLNLSAAFPPHGVTLDEFCDLLESIHDNKEFNFETFETPEEESARKKRDVACNTTPSLRQRMEALLKEQRERGDVQTPATKRYLECLEKLGIDSAMPPHGMGVNDFCDLLEEMHRSGELDFLNSEKRNSGSSS